MKSRVLKIQDYAISDEPYYQPIADEVNVFNAAYGQQLPVLIKGPTGCGKTRFMEHMAWRLKRPLITVSCHDDLTASDLVGRFLISGGETVWVDGPLWHWRCATAQYAISMKSSRREKIPWW